MSRILSLSLFFVKLLTSEGTAAFRMKKCKTRVKTLLCVRDQKENHQQRAFAVSDTHVTHVGMPLVGDADGLKAIGVTPYTNSNAFPDLKRVCNLLQVTL